MMRETIDKSLLFEVLLSLKWRTISENELILHVQKDNGEAFVELASRYLPLIHRMAFPYRSSLSETEDLSQEGLLGLYFAARTYQQEGTASFSTYARACISNRIISAYRKAQGKRNKPLRDFVSLEESESGVDTLPASEGDPEALLIDRENMDVLLCKVQKNLTKMEQKVLLYYASGFSYQEISDKMEISIKSVGNAMQRVRRKLRAAF